MKLHPFAIGAIALASAAGANAQANTGNVTLYGIVDAYVQVANGQSTLSRVQSGGLSGSRFGLKATEDLGNGLRALFQIESGINLDDGTNGQGAFWGRQAFVGLATPYGQLTLGRQYGSVYTLSSEFSVFSNNSTGPSTAVIGGFGGYEPVRGGTTGATGNGGPARVNNSVKYESPSFNGFKAGGLVGMGEVSGSTTKTRLADVYGRYTAGPFDAMVSLVDDRVASTALDVRTVSAAAAYSFGDARVTGGVISVNDRGTANADGQGWWVGGDYRVGLNLFKAQYVENKVKNGEGKTRAIGAGYQYDLSKRTNLYSSLTYFKNEGAGYTDRWASSLPAGLTSSSDRNITEVVGGIRHSF
ncbi:MAG TPA: porin [Albitalea sp.]|uniref:porin n=1 Tax=Piscinibacter sp. TaxID=1903157 RepID=UPI002ED563BF